MSLLGKRIRRKMGKELRESNRELEEAKWRIARVQARVKVIEHLGEIADGQRRDN
jgi:hypothetical protein